MICPLCSSVEVNKVESVNTAFLTQKYKKMLDLDFSYIIGDQLNYCACLACGLLFFDPPIPGDEKFYNALQQFDWYYMDEKEEYKIAKQYIDKDERVLEIGSGKGAFAKHIEAKEYVGLDSSRKAKQMAEKNGIKIENETIQSYGDKNPTLFDVVISFQVLEHVASPGEFIKAQLKLLKKGGKLLVAVPSEDSFLKHATNNILNMPPHHLTRWTDSTLKYLARMFDLELMDLIHIRLEPVHQKMFMITLVQNVVMLPKLLDNSVVRRINSFFSNMVSQVLLRSFKDEMLPNGQTVMAVYKKR